MTLRVDRFYKKLQARQQYIAEVEARAAARTSLDRPLTEMDLGARATEALSAAGVLTVGDVLNKLNEGEASLLSIDGFGRKAMADMKKRLRQFGYELPETAADAA
ncbi:MAG: DNA-directed RNA polymerase subunit alpha C-terminal domain-containing protein [Chloroflexota bacterium]